MPTIKETYNGWTNYETWRVNLECVDGFQWSADEITFESVYDLSEYIRESVETMVLETSPEGLARDYATAFLSAVNYYEIAQHVADDQPSLITGINTQDGKILL